MKRLSFTSKKTMILLTGCSTGGAEKVQERKNNNKIRIIIIK